MTQSYNGKIYVDFCFNRNCNDGSHFRVHEGLKRFNYNKSNILKFINSLDCDFKHIETVTHEIYSPLTQREDLNPYNGARWLYNSMEDIIL